MHIYAITRGTIPVVSQFYKDLTSLHLPYEYEKGKSGNLQIGMRAIQLWEFCFPEKYLDVMNATLTDEREIETGTKYGVSEAKIFALRKLLKSDKLPSVNPKVLALPVIKKDLQILKIGMKPDKFYNGVEAI
jgi:hypothetical protein